MKTIIGILSGLMLLVLSAKSLSGQITLEHEYAYPVTTSGSKFYMVKLSSSDKYVQEVRMSQTIRRFDIYNDNHSLYKSIYLPYDSSNYNGYAVNISDHLFNADNKVEIMYQYIYSGPQPYYVIRVLDEDSNVVFSIDSALTSSSINGDISPVYKNSAGNYKLLVSIMQGGNMRASRVYSLPGTLPMMVKPVSNQREVTAAEPPYPNPAQSKVTIPYRLPANAERGEIIFYNVNGAEVKRFTVTKAFTSLELTDELETGSYFYHLKTNGEASGAKKLVVVK